MEKNDSMNRFLSGEVAAASTEFIHNAMKALQNESKENTVDQFVSALKECLNDGRVCFLQITLIHHKVLLGKEFYHLQGFDSSFYLSPPIFESVLDWDWMYHPYYEFCRKIRDESKRYVMQFQKKDIDQICMLELDETKHIVRRLFSEAVSDLIRSKEFCAFGIKTGLQIQLSDYMGEYEELYTFDNESEKLGAMMNGVLQNHSSDRIQ